MLSFCSFLDNFWHSSVAGRAWVSEQAIRVSFPILDVPKNWIQPQLKLYSWFNVQMQLAYLCFSYRPCIIQTGSEGPDTEGQGEKNFFGVGYVSASHVVHLPSPLHMPCWVELITREACLSSLTLEENDA